MVGPTTLSFLWLQLIIIIAFLNSTTLMSMWRLIFTGCTFHQHHPFQSVDGIHLFLLQFFGCAN